MDFEKYEVISTTQLGFWEAKIVRVDESEMGKLIILKYLTLPSTYPHSDLWVIFPYENNLGNFQIYPVLQEDEETGDEVLSAKNFLKYQQVSRYLFNRFQMSLPDVNWIDDIIKVHFQMDFYEFERWVTQMTKF